jgi:hypothetical protein
VTAPGYSGRPQAAKLGLKPGQRVSLHQPPPGWALTGPPGGLAGAWPRRAAGHRSDITENYIRDQALPIGLVDVKVAAIDEDWSGLRLVWRVENRR